MIIKPRMFLLLALAALAVAGGCQSGSIRGDALDPIATPVLDRHDSLIRGTMRTEDLSQVEKDTALRSSAIMRDMIQAAKGTPKP